MEKCEKIIENKIYHILENIFQKYLKIISLRKYFLIKKYFPLNQNIS